MLSLLNNLPTQLHTLLSPHIPASYLNPLSSLALLIGTYRLLSISFSLLRYLQRHLLRPLLQPADRIFRRYGVDREGKRSWALVTGGSDGIGLEMCK